MSIKDSIMVNINIYSEHCKLMIAHYQNYEICEENRIKAMKCYDEIKKELTQLEQELTQLRAIKKRLENEIGKRESHRRYNLPYQGLNLLKEILSGDKKRV